MLIHNFYYYIRPLIPRSLQIFLRRRVVLWKRKLNHNNWPIDDQAATPPEGWAGWPEKKQFALVLHHDVDTAKGHKKCHQIIELEEKMGFRSSFNFVPERYTVSSDLRRYLIEKGFEVCVHGLKHDGKLFLSRDKFKKQAIRIRHYLNEWQSVGFVSPSMHRNLDWIGELEIEHDCSTFDVDPYEPQPEGVKTIFPFWVFATRNVQLETRNSSNPSNSNNSTNPSNSSGFVELPYTLPQDFTLFVLMKETDISIWKRKLDWIAEKGGMALLITHPDYMNFNHGRPAQEEYPVQFYEEFLQYVRTKYDEKYWHVLPKDMARYWEENHRDSVISDISLSSLRKEKVEKQARRKLRVAMLSYSFYDIDARVARYAETLARRGDHVDVISLGHPGQPPYVMKNGVHVFQIQTRKRDEKGKIAYLARILKFFAKSSRFIQKRHRKNPYDVIHVHSVPDFEVFAAWFPKLRGTKIILDIHDIVPEFYAAKFKASKDSFFYKMLVLAERISGAFSDHVIISNHIWEKTLRRSVNGEKCSVCLNYPDPLLFHKRPRVRNDGKFIMMYPGSLNWHQGLDLAIGAFSMISDGAPEAEFHIYGEGDTRKVLMGLVSQLGLEEKIIFHNMLPKEQIVEVMANADLAVVPKRNDSFGGEAFSTKILEFMSLGVPVVISATKIDKHYFNDSVVKFFAPEDEKDLAESMLKMIKDEYLRQHLAENASTFVEEFSWDKRKWEYLNLVDRLTRGS